MRFGLKATPRKITMGSVDSEARGVQSSPTLCRIKRQLVCLPIILSTAGEQTSGGMRECDLLMTRQ